MPFKTIDLSQYHRRAHFDYFRTLAYPYVGVTVNVDVTALAACCKERRASFYLTFLHAAALAANDVKALRQRIHGDGIVEYDSCPTSHIELLEDGTYCYCTLRHEMELEAYWKNAEEARARCRETGGIQEDEDVESMLFISTLPWLTYTSLTQPVAGGDESNPRITWGKYQAEADGKLHMPVSILAHHALVDGIHLAQFYQRLTERMREIAG